MKQKINTYKDLIGLFINQIKDDKYNIYFVTNNKITIKIPKFVPYCACNVGEYIDRISYDGICFGTITNIEENVDDKLFDSKNGIIYKGNVTFYFENGKINMDVHGEDNDGYYGVSFTMPCEVFMNEVTYNDYLKLSGEITESLDNTATYENWLIIQEYIDILIKENKQLKEQLEASEKARKEAIEYIYETRIPIWV